MTRVAALVLLAIVGGASCGGDDQAADRGTGADGGGGPGLSVHVEEGELVPGARVTWLITPTNLSDAPLTLAFADAQRADVVLERDGEVAYRWSDGRFFAQARGEVVVPAGGRVTFRLEEPSLGVEPGVYREIVTVVSESHGLTSERTVTVDLAP